MAKLTALPSLATRHPSHFGGHKAVVRPDPIPNSAVKHSLADGSSPIGSARVGSRQSFNKNPEKRLRVFCFSGFIPDRGRLEAGCYPILNHTIFK